MSVLSFQYYSRFLRNQDICLLKYCLIGCLDYLAVKARHRIEEINFLISFFTPAAFNPRQKYDTSKEHIKRNDKLKLTSSNTNYGFSTESRYSFTCRKVTVIEPSASNPLLTGVFLSLSRNLTNVHPLMKVIFYYLCLPKQLSTRVTPMILRRKSLQAAL